jgi:hypothetical protein
MKTKIKIESIFGKLIFEHETEDNTIKKTLEEAVKSGADLRGAYLRGANLGEDWGKLSSASDVLVVGAIGSRNGYTTIFHTDKGIFVQCGCFRGTLDEFAAKVKETHAGTKHERDYNALIDFVKIKFSDYDTKTN